MGTFSLKVRMQFRFKGTFYLQVQAFFRFKDISLQEVGGHFRFKGTFPLEIRWYFFVRGHFSPRTSWGLFQLEAIKVAKTFSYGVHDVNNEPQPKREMDPLLQSKMYCLND